MTDQTPEPAAPADPPTPEREAVPEPRHTPEEQHTGWADAMSELSAMITTGFDNVNQQIAEMRGKSGTDETPEGVPWTHRGRRRE